MAIKRSKTNQGLFLLMFLFSCLCTCKGSEFGILMSTKSSLMDPFNSLSNWNSSLSFCQWNGISCDNSSHVAKIELTGKNISGKLSESIFRLRNIEIIDLSDNLLSGEIPRNISSCMSLKFLNLSNNNLTGPLPRGAITKLETLDLSSNMLYGNIPEEIGFYSGLKFLDLGGNTLYGRIPSSITNLTSLQVLTLASNQLFGQIPPELGLMKSLNWIYLGYNNFSGEIPKEIGELTSLNHLNLVCNNLTGEIPPSMGNLTNLKYLFLYLNKLSGSTPRSIFGLKSLISLDLSDNFLSGEIPEDVGQLQNLEILHLFSNHFYGKIPNALASLPHLRILQLWSNRLSGEIPKALGKRNNLTLLDLSTNNLTGEIPKSLCESRNLFKLILFSNSLQGQIPKSLSHCMSLGRLRLQDNRLSGELSPEFTQLPLVYYLDISSNNFYGLLSHRKWDMPELQMLNLARNRFSGELPNSFGSKKLENLDLSNNRLSGLIPSSVGKFSELMQLNLRENKLSGEIPNELSSCKKLVSLDLSHNQLTGQIPTSISEMPVLSTLDLSVNQLSGKVPENLGKVESLVMVNISHNHLHGNLPSTGAFLAINSSSVSGNNLCGGDDTTSGLPPCKRVKFSVWKLSVTFLLAVLALLGVVFTVIALVRRRNVYKVKRVESDDGNWKLQVFGVKDLKYLTMDDILLSKRDENVISSGKNGISYKGKSAMNSMHFVVKELNHINSNQTEFWMELGEISKIRHPNIVKLIATCRSEKGGFVVYEYCEGRRLSDAIRGLSWERRKKIAYGIVRALRYMHCRCSPSFVMGDLSPEKVTVDGKDEPHLRLSLPELDCKVTKGFTFSAYVSPETTQSNEITEKGDIYGFGLILIELLTGRNPAHFEMGPHKNIVEWARYCYSDCHVDSWIDPVIKGHMSDNHNEIVETMNLALQCTAGDPAARPCASDVAKTLDSISRSSSCVLGFKFSSNV